MPLRCKTGLWGRPFRLFSVLAGLILSGCAAVGPDYRRPEMPAPSGWHTRLEGGLNPGETAPQTLAAWWSIFDDPLLSSLVERAAAGNLDLKKARAALREARARRGGAKAGLFPTLDTTAAGTRMRSGDDLGTHQTQDLYSGTFDAGWELDVFGGTRRSVEAATADLQAGEEDLRDVLVSLLAEVALNYVEVRTCQARLAVAEANLEAQKETHQLTLWRYQAGLSDELAVQQARYNLESTRSELPTLRTGLEEAMNRIAVLLGERPGKVHEELEKQTPVPVAPLEVAVGVPVDLLRRRPDLRRTERQLAAQTARIGVATADLYPKISLSGSIGVEALSVSSQTPYRAWSLSGGPKITWAIFRAGAIRRNIEIHTALQEQYLVACEAAVLKALEEVENALVAYAEEQRKREALGQGEAAARKAVEMAKQKYEAGLTDFNVVLDAQRSLLSLQNQLAQSSGTITSNLVRLYKALGGGWTSMTSEGSNQFLQGEEK
jgi:NodT family efflux transporter outer membrane factor (OMF) lipoprotein